MASGNDPDYFAARNLQSCEHKSARAKECLQAILEHLPIEADFFEGMSVGTRQYLLYSIRHAISILDGTEEIVYQSANPFAKETR